MPMPLNVNDYQRIRWACRRGMLELDILLGSFCENCYENLSEEDKQSFVELLQEEDPEIFQSIMGQKQCHAKYTKIIGLIKQNTIDSL